MIRTFSQIVSSFILHPSSFFFCARAGFTLVEILVSMMILGLSVSGLLGFLQWGSENYAAISDNWRRQAALVGFQNEIRKMVARGVSPDQVPANLIETFLPKNGKLRLEKFEVTPYASARDAFFVKALFYIDDNRNRVHEPREAEIQRVWCFRRRDSQ